MELLGFDGVALSTDTVPDESSCGKCKANTILKRKDTSNLLPTLVVQTEDVNLKKATPDEWNYFVTSDIGSPHNSTNPTPSRLLFRKNYFLATVDMTLAPFSASIVLTSSITKATIPMVMTVVDPISPQIFSITYDVATTIA